MLSDSPHLATTRWLFSRGKKVSLLRVGTRASVLAKTQTQTVVDMIKTLGIATETHLISNPGDNTMEPIHTIGVGVFTSSLRHALHSQKIDIIVHSAKDLPTAPEPGLIIAAYLPRADPRDALLTATGDPLITLPSGSTIGTSAPRRIAHLRALGLGLSPQPLRGNVDTRLRLLKEKKFDAIVLALAGLKRLGLTHLVSEKLDPALLPPAPAQGALAVECRSDDQVTRAVLAQCDHLLTRYRVESERTVLAELHAGCLAPIGAYADIAESVDDQGNSTVELSLRASLCSLDGVSKITASATGPVQKYREIGVTVAQQLREKGADDEKYSLTQT